ncbi:MAG: riboflavin synthase [Planctomycetota bacterium]
MFTGIIQRVGTVASIEERPFGVRLAIDHHGWAHTPRSGDSIAIDGCCLTLSDGWTHDVGHYTFDAIRETLDTTALGDRRPGDRVNLEPSLRADAMLDGHLVQGHVEATGEVVRVDDDPSDWRMAVRVPPDLMPCVVPKGSVALDGVSLTIASVEPDGLTVALIPTTLERTNFRDRTPGDRINVETDILARTVAHQIRHFAPELMKK